MRVGLSAGLDKNLPDEFFFITPTSLARQKILVLGSRLNAENYATIFV